ncbi:hypothetical protein BJ085DRAFT_22433, partial [Dimargaris cristalligena]
LYYLLCVLTGGILYVLGRWFPKRRIAFVAAPTPLDSADWLVVTNEWGNYHVEPIIRQPYAGTFESVFPGCSLPNGCVPFHFDRLTYFEHRHNRFLFNPIERRYQHVNSWKPNQWSKTPKQTRAGLTSRSFQERFDLFGANTIEILEKSLVQLLMDEILHPFYVFQIASMALWFSDDYYYYATCIFIISVVSIIATYRETRKNEQRMCEMARFECPLSVFRGEAWVEVSSHQLVPGDVFEVSDPSLHQVPCDAILLEGDCIVNESMLTGESIPVSKTPAVGQTLRDLDMTCLNPGPEVARHTLFCGTRLIRVRTTTPGMGGRQWQTYHQVESAPRATALVIRTGFNTSKGSLIRSILFPRPNKFKFYQDAFRFVGVMAIIACLGFLASIANFVRLGLHAGIIIKRALDLITIVVPPALPATMSIGMTFALNRLRKQRIYCTSPPRINVSGKVDILCFDKTGTLTEDGLDVLGVQFVDRNQGQLVDLCSSVGSLNRPSAGTQQTAMGLLHAMATCHSLKVVDGDVIGDPIDIKMFEFTSWTIEEGGSLCESRPPSSRQFGFQDGIVPTVVRPPNIQRFSLDDLLARPGTHFELGVIRSFEFLPSLRRMSVIVKAMQSPSMQVFVKGAPEVMLQICRPETIPADFHATLNQYTQHGYRVIACAGKTLERKMNWLRVQKVKRDQLETNLDFLGFIVFENKLKPTTAGVIKTLGEANIRQVMCTGDNVLTAVSVARECGIVGEHQPVYSARCLEGSFADGPGIKLVWEDIERPDHILDPYSLEPLRISSGLGPNTAAVNQIPHALALTGEAVRWILDNSPRETLEQVLIKCQVFARMSPDEKQEMVEKLQEIDYCVGFCGDGANDCGALKAADVGLSLSEAEASVAAPFTSQSTDITCVLDLIREGRCALTTSFSCFKYMALYSMIQFVTVSLLYRFGASLGDFQFLFIDLFIIIPIAIFMGNSPPYHKLHTQAPAASLISQPVLSSLFGHIILVFGFQYLPMALVQNQPYYVEPDRDSIDDDHILVNCYENTVLFLVSNFQYIFTAVVFSIGPPYRRSSIHNYPFIATTVLLLVFSSVVLLLPREGYFWTSLFELVTTPSLSNSFTWTVWGIAVANCVVSWIAERYVLQRLSTVLVSFAQRVIKRVFGKSTQKRPKRFEELLGKARH